MAGLGSPVPPGRQLDFQQLLSEAQHRWLRPAEICGILSNYQKFIVAPEPPNRPPSGSLYLFDRKVLRYFRKDRHNWRKKKDGKTVKEAHEKLKVGSVDVLHCYYAHGEVDENFQRRCYWMLETDLMHIVFVHYLEVKGNKTSMGGIRGTDSGTNFEKNSPMSFSFPTDNSHSAISNSTSPTSTLSSLCEDADSGDSRQSSSRVQSHLESTQMENSHVLDTIKAHLSADNISAVNNVSPGHGESPFVIQSQETLGLGSWEEVLKQSTQEFQTGASHESLSSFQHGISGTVLGQEILGVLLSDEGAVKQGPGYNLPVQSDWQTSFEVPPHSPRWSMGQTSDMKFDYDACSSFPGQRSQLSDSQNLHQPLSFDQQYEQFFNNFEQPSDESQSNMNSMLENGMFMEGNNPYTLNLRQQLEGGGDGLKKVDSFSRWMTKELGEVADLHVSPTSGISWSSVECVEVVDELSLSPSVSQDQLFSIIDFTPKWAYSGSEIEVLIAGIFLKNPQEVAKHNWSCMFGEVEVPVEVIADGILCCVCPSHVVGQVPFYVTRSNRLSCSEVREFEFRDRSTKNEDAKDIYSSATSKMHLHLRLERFLSLRSAFPLNDHHIEGLTEKNIVINTLLSMKEEEDCYQTLDPTPERVLPRHEVMEKLLEKRVKEKVYSWLLHKVAESGKGPSILDTVGQGLTHLAAALGYDWAIKPTVAAGVSINFRDANGWTALHWAAFCGREQTVAVLVSLNADPGALTDPTPEFPRGRTPADLASTNGHKGISGFLAESSLTSHFLSLTVKDPKDDINPEVSGSKAVQTVSERTATPFSDGDVPDVLCLKDSLTAVCNATQAADRIHQVFRMQSFQRKQQQVTEFGNELDLSEEYALAVAAGKSRKPGPSDGQVNSAAVQIQKKYRGWKKRKEFLIIRQRIVKIQAHVRGHQVRKQYKAITWSVGILEKVILRWRRKGSGLRGFRPDSLAKEPDHQGMPPKEDDYDFLKEGRKQTEERLQKALTRVKSMVQYPEARAQYRRLLNVVEGINESKVSDMTWNSTEDTSHDQDDLFDIDSLLGDDAFMPMGFE